jgi:methionine--tRNA ligase beta chain
VPPPAQSDAARVDLRVGVITKVWPHESADKLWCEEVDVGEAAPRRIASGLRAYYSQEAMLGRRIVVVCNLKPRAMVGFTSEGMVLCASNADRSVVEFVDPPAGAAPGDRILIDGHADSAAPVPEVINPSAKKNPWVPFAAELKTNADRVATYLGVPLRTAAGVCTAPTVANGPIS